MVFITHAKIHSLLAFCMSENSQIAQKDENSDKRYILI